MRRHTVLVVLFLWRATVAVSAQGTGILVGTVTSATGDPVSGLAVTFTGENTEVTARTDSDGNYRLPGLLPGRYSLTPEEPSSVLEPAFPVSVVADITIRRDLTLRTEADSRNRARGGDRLVGASPGLSATVFDFTGRETRNTSFATFLQRVPGVTVSRAGGIGHPTSVRVRGAPASDRFLLTDGLPFDDFASALHVEAPLEWSRLEAVRGAPSSSQGGELSGGGQRLTRPAGDAGASALTVGVETGDQGWQHFEATATGQQGAYDWSVGAQHLETDNQQPNSAFSQSGVAGIFGVTRDAASLDLMFRGEMSTLGLPGPTLLVPADLDASEERTQWMSGATFRLRRGSTTTHEARVVVSQTNRLSLNPGDSGTAVLLPADRVGLRLDLPDFAQVEGLRNDGQTAQLLYEYTRRADEFHFLTLGGAVDGQSGRFGPDDAFNQRRLNLVVYGEDRMQALEGLTATVGGRVEKSGPYAIVAMPRGSVRYELGRGFHAHGSVGTSVGTPTLGQRFNETFDHRRNLALQLAHSTVFDGGIAGTLWANRARVDLTAFRHNYEDLIVLGDLDRPGLESLAEFRALTLAERVQLIQDVQDGLREPLVAAATFDQVRMGYTNIPRSRAQGAELTLTTTLMPQIEMGAVYTLTDSLVTEGTSLIRPGRALADVPRHQGTLTADVQLGRVSVGGTLRYVGERTAGIDVFSSVLGRDMLDAYTRLDTRVLVDLSDRIALSLIGDNLTDERYQEVLGYPALGRLVRAGLQVDF